MALPVPVSDVGCRWASRVWLFRSAQPFRPAILATVTNRPSPKFRFWKKSLSAAGMRGCWGVRRGGAGDQVLRARAGRPAWCRHNECRDRCGVSLQLSCSSIQHISYHDVPIIISYKIEITAEHDCKPITYCNTSVIIAHQLLQHTSYYNTSVITTYQLL